MPKESFDLKKTRANKIIAILSKTYPDVKCFLTHDSPLQLLVAVILSAQCTDARVNMTTPALFKRFKTAKDFAGSDIEELESLVKSTGFYRNKARSIKNMSIMLLEKFDGQVPGTIEELVTLPGVGRKTANVILTEVFNIPSVVVDTHVTRLSNRLDLARGMDAVKLEFALMALINKKYWSNLAHWLISHGRAICVARTPLCTKCQIMPLCPQRGVTKSR